MKLAEKLREEYLDLNNRITEAFKTQLGIIGKIVYQEEDFVDDGEISDDDIPMYNEVSDCPTSYYIDNNGDTLEIYITKIDSDGIHIVEYGEGEKSLCIDFSELDGINCKLEVLELIS